MKVTLLRSVFFVSFIAIAVLVRTNTGGPGWSYTNAPVTSTSRESNCTNCHGSFSLQTSGSNHGRISLRGNYTGNGYIPDSTYTLILGYRETGKSKFGFQMTCLEETSYKPAGTFTNGDSRSQTGTSVVNGNTRYYIGHTSTGSAGVTSDSTSWRIQWKAPRTNVGKVVFWVVLNVTDGGSGTNGDYIYSKSFTISPSTLLPTAKVKVLDANICANTQLSFAADVTGSPTSYSWTFPSGSPSSSTSSAPKVSYSNAGTYRAILTVRNSKGASIPDTLTFTVKAGPAVPVISPSGTQNICEGDSLRLSTTPATGVTYKWTPNNESRQSFFTRDSGLYSVTVTSNSTGCSRTSTAPVRIIVNPVPGIKLEKSMSGDSICSNTLFTVTARKTAGPADSISFNSASGPYNTDTVQQFSFASGNPTITAWVKSSKGCRSSASTAVEVRQPKAGPLAGISARQLNSFRVSWDPVNGATGYKVSTDTGKTFTDPSSGATGLYHDVTGLVGGQRRLVKIKALMTGLCSETQTVDIEGRADTCSPIPFTLKAAEARTCKGGQAAVTISGLSGKSISVKIDGVAAGSDTLLSIVMNGTRTYDIEVMDNSRAECGYTLKKITLTEDTVGAPLTSLTGQKVRLICTSQTTTTLPVTVTAATDRDSVLWYRNNNPEHRSISGSHSFSVSDGDSVWPVAINARGCSSRGETTVIRMPGLPSAAFTFGSSGYDYTFTASDTAGTHSWNGPGGASGAGKTWSINLEAFKGTTVKIYHTVNRNGCGNMDSLSIAVANLGNRKNAATVQARWYPNPATEELQVDISGRENAVVSIQDATGRVVYSTEMPAGTHKINAASFTPGTYLINIRTSSGTIGGSLIIRR